MIYFFTPYSLQLKLLDAIDQYMQLLQPDDWAVIMDGDIMFLHPDFGHQIERHIMAHPHTGLFTSYASRCHYRTQVPEGVDMENDSIRYHKRIANIRKSIFYGESRQIERKIAGHLMVIQKRTWDRIRAIVLETASGKHILGVDTKISKAVMTIGLKILLMEDVYVLHYCRLEEGFDYKNHIEPCTIE